MAVCFISLLYALCADNLLENLKLTPLRTANIPPPMALHELSLESNVVDVAILEPKDSKDLAMVAILMSAGIEVYSWNIIDKPTQFPLLLASQTDLSVKNKKTCTYSALMNEQIAFSNDGNVMFLKSYQAGSTIVIYSIKNGILELVKSADYSLVLGVIRSISRNESMPYTFLGSGKVVLDPELTGSSPAKEFTSKVVVASFPSSTYKVEVVDVEDQDLMSSNLSVRGSKFSGGTCIAFGLTSNGALYANERCLTKDCTSFLLTPTHLIFTSTQHLLKFVHLAPVLGE